MRLYFVRHGQASHDAPTDAARPLTAKGEDDVRRMASVLAQLGAAPQHIYASPRVRAQQTAAIIAQALGQTVETRAECDFSFSLDKVVAMTRDLREDEAAMFVGHNPSMTEVVGTLTGGQVDMKPGAIACAFAYVPQPRGGALEWFLIPRLATALAADA